MVKWCQVGVSENPYNDKMIIYFAEVKAWQNSTA